MQKEKWKELGWVSLTGQTYENTKVTVGQMHPDDTQPTVEAWNEAVKQRKIFILNIV
jgi:hypothetical protein